MKWKPADHVTEEEVFGRKKKKKAEIIFDSSFREPPKPPKFRKEEKCSRCGKTLKVGEFVFEEGVGFVCINCVG
jgi:hypothetical protein